LIHFYKRLKPTVDMSLYSTFKNGKSFVRKKNKTEVPRADSFVFRLHYQFTFTILWVASMMVVGQQYIDTSGSAIQCMLEKGIGVRGDVINSYCWIMSTFTLPRHYLQGDQNVDWIHPGVGPMREEEETIYHAYYQWVPFMLFFQAACFYLPHWIWKQLEGGKLENIILGLNEAITGKRCNHTDCTIKDHDELCTCTPCTPENCKVNQLATYMKDRIANPWDHQVWAAKFYFCEFLNLINIIFQIIITDIFLGYSFSNFGIAAVGWSSEEDEYRTDPLSRVFPRMTKCHFHKYGGSGTIEKVDALCVLGMNIVNEKVYVFLWFWFMFLAVVTSVTVLVRLLPLLIPSVRPWGAYNMKTIMDKFHFRHNSEGGDLRAQRHRTMDMLGKLTFADWLVVKHLGQCMDRDNFSDLINMMSNNFDTRENLKEKESDGSTLPSKSRLTVDTSGNENGSWSVTEKLLGIGRSKKTDV